MRRFIFVLIICIFSFGSFSCAGSDTTENPSVSPTAEPTKEIPGQPFFPPSSYSSVEAKDLCGPLAESLQKEDALGIIVHTTAYRSRDTGRVVHAFNSPRLGMSSRVNSYVLTARHVVELVDLVSPEVVLSENLEREDRYVFYPLDEFFGPHESVLPFQRFYDGLSHGRKNGISLTRIFDGSELLDFAVFEISSGIPPVPFVTPAPPFTEFDFEPLCFFRIYIDSEFTSVTVRVILGKSFTEKRSVRELGGDFMPPEDREGGVFSFYGGFVLGPGASGSPAFLRDQQGAYHLVGIVVAQRGFVGIGHDITVIQRIVLAAVLKDIFKSP